VSWETVRSTARNTPTDAQIELMIDLCDELHYDYEELAPVTFSEARELIGMLLEERRGKRE